MNVQSSDDPGIFTEKIKPIFQKYCIQCHGPNKSKGRITIHTMNGDLLSGQDLENWEKVLDVLKSGEMPPEDETQLQDNEKSALINWIDSGLKAYLAKASNETEKALTRRLTNLEYQNTVRDLIGFELKLIDSLPEDPVKPYHFNNSADYMLMGPDQIMRYKENARKIMASVIVDPQEPKPHTISRQWKSGDITRGMGGDEIGIYGNRRHTPASGIGLKSWPETGRFRIRIKASAILPEGFSEMPLRLIMGYSMHESGTVVPTEPIGTVHLKNNVDNPKIYEFYGRIENYPVQPGKPTKKGVTPDSLHITIQNLFDDGSLNDGLDPLAYPRAVIESFEFEAPVYESWPPAYHKRILFDSPLRKSNIDAYVKEVLKRFMSRAFRRPAGEREIDSYFKIYKMVASDKSSLEEAMRETLSMVLISPQFLYHTQADDQTSKHFELASRLSYFLWGSMPDEQLYSLAASGKLNDADILSNQVLRLLSDKRSESFISNFTSQWLSLDKMKTVPINNDLFPRFLYLIDRGEKAGQEVPYRITVRDFMIEETVGFIGQLIKNNSSVLQIIDSDFAYLNERLAIHYGVDGVKGQWFRPVKLNPEHKLGGLLTHGSILIGNSTGSAPHPIYRAVWLREAILGDHVSEPPADVPALVDSVGEKAEKALTIKDLLEQHRQKESCNDCHVRLDPWGIPFERYNAIGKYQPVIPKDGTRVPRFNSKNQSIEQYLKSVEKLNTVKVQADARVPHGPKIDGMSDLKAFLLKYRKHDVAENMIRRLLTYGLGRELSFRDRYEVEKILVKSKENDFKIRDMIISICLSNTFRGIEK